MEEPARLQSMGSLESDTTEWLHFCFSLSCIGEGNGNPLQCSCWRIPGTEEPGGLPSMGSHRVGHDWSDLAAAAAAAGYLRKWRKRISVQKWLDPWRINQFSSVQLLSHVWLFATLWIPAHQACLSITNSQSLLNLLCIESVMHSEHLILCCPLLLPPSIFPRIRVFPMSQVFTSGGQILAFQLQHQSFQWIFRTDFL